ncbi:TRAF3-interacting protein 1-like isoform X1 [Portunus trituberculatus]|uniref:TRAF3-interacting protein 1-like isoform X1 n=1 Tax=Portunus trituberculatus TaxID=210409 RepID=UPI001E1CB436|nr:TRAF3-interacting protein 1-like isoform X1 [Portunus trituberculatus]
MATAVGPEILKRTQAELGKFIKRPPLTDKLLSKPPFRFLHDVVNAIITETGFLAGLYTDDELSSQNIKDKEAKVEFLQKCIDATVLATGENLSVRPSKIVAGHEADKTNEWLQALGRAVAKNVDSSEAVSQVLSGVRPQAKKAEKKAEKSKEKSDKEKKGGTASNKAQKNNPNDPKPSQSRTPSRTPAPRTPAQPSPGSKGPGKAKLAVEAKTVPLNKSPAKGTAAPRGSTVKSSKNKDDKDKTAKKSRSKPKEEESGTKSSKDKDKDGKERKQKSSSEKGKSAKSRPASRAQQVKESGKENSPPHEVIGATEILTNGHATPEEMVSTPKQAPSRPPSARHDGNGGETVEVVDAIDEGIVTQEAPTEEAQIPQEEEERPILAPLAPEGSRTAAEEGLETSNGPSMLIDPEVEGQPEVLGGGGEQGQEQLVTPSSPNNNNIDPAILKAMSPHNADQLQGVDVPRPEPPDSGVGSLESPKHAAKEQEGPPTAPTPRPGPQPLRALEPFKEGTNMTTEPVMPETETPGNQSKGELPVKEGAIRPRTGRRSARPPSARPAPPRVRERREVPKEEIQRPGTAKPVANVILPTSSNDGDDDDDDNFVVEESKPAVAVEDDVLPLAAAAASGAAAAAAAAGENGQGAGLLVAQILETKKEMEDGRRNAFSPETPGHRRVPIEQSLLSDANRKKERELIQKDVQKLSASIQSITRSVNPLAKMLDYLQEDLDSMQKELESWQSENKTLAQTLKQEQSSTEQALEPLGYQLMELETAVQEQRDKLSAVKSNILRNNEKISRLMSGINLNI